MHKLLLPGSTIIESPILPQVEIEIYKRRFVLPFKTDIEDKDFGNKTILQSNIEPEGNQRAYLAFAVVPPIIQNFDRSALPITYYFKHIYLYLAQTFKKPNLNRDMDYCTLTDHPEYKTAYTFLTVWDFYQEEFVRFQQEFLSQKDN